MSADLLRRLIEAGTPAELVAEVAMLAGEAAVLERRRSSDRERQAARRHVMSRDTSDVTDATDNPPNEIYSNPPIPPVEADASTAPKGRSDRGSKIPVDWEAPAVADLSPEAKALAEKWPAAAYRAEAEAFRNYWLGESGAKARKSDWNRAWANRIVAVNGKVMREAKFASPAPVGRSNGRPMNVQELRSAIRFAEDNDDPERAAELKRQLAAITPSAVRATGPPAQSIGEIGKCLVSGVSQ